MMYVFSQSFVLLFAELECFVFLRVVFLLWCCMFGCSIIEVGCYLSVMF